MTSHRPTLSGARAGVLPHPGIPAQTIAPRYFLTPDNDGGCEGRAAQDADCVNAGRIMGTSSTAKPVNVALYSDPSRPVFIDTQSEPGSWADALQFPPFHGMSI